MGEGDLHPSVERVRTAAAARGLAISPRRFPAGTRTAQDAAEAIGVEVAQIVKSLVFAVDGEIVVALVSGADQLDEAKLAEAAGGFHCQRVEPDLVRSTTGFPIGGVAPFGHATELRVFVDRRLLDHDEVWAAAGTPTDVFPIAPADLQRATDGVVCDLAR